MACEVYGTMPAVMNTSKNEVLYYVSYKTEMLKLQK